MSAGPTWAASLSFLHANRPQPSSSGQAGGRQRWVLEGAVQPPCKPSEGTPPCPAGPRSTPARLPTLPPHSPQPSSSGLTGGSLSAGAPSVGRSSGQAGGRQRWVLEGAVQPPCKPSEGTPPCPAGPRSTPARPPTLPPHPPQLSSSGLTGGSLSAGAPSVGRSSGQAGGRQRWVVEGAVQPPCRQDRHGAPYAAGPAPTAARRPTPPLHPAHTPQASRPPHPSHPSKLSSSGLTGGSLSAGAARVVRGPTPPPGPSP